MPSGSPPPGAWGGGQRWHATAGLRTAATILLWVTTAACGLFALSAFRRKSLWDGDSSSLSELEDADVLVAAAFSLFALCALATVIVISIWSLRAGRNAELRGARDVSPGLACGSWYIPIGWFIVPFIQLRRITRVHGRSTTPSGWWQGMFIAGWVLMAVSRGQVTDSALEETEDLVDQLQYQGVFALLATACLAAAAFFAASAMRNADGA